MLRNLRATLPFISGAFMNKMRSTEGWRAASQLGAWTTLAKDRSSGPSTYIKYLSPITPALGRSKTLF